MNLVASLIVRNELGRYLRASVEMLLGLVDSVAILDDASTDGLSWGSFRDPRVHIRRLDEQSFYRHEGRARQAALDFALELEPSHIVVVDGDELLVHAGQATRDEIEAATEAFVPVPPVRPRGTDRRRRHTRWPANGAWSFVMEEVWGCDQDGLLVRQDGGWQPHGVTILYRPELFGRDLADRALASGRVPSSLNHVQAIPTGHPIFHMGWARVAEREARHARYVEHDGGAFHASAHLASIMWPDDRVTLRRREWPDTVPRSVIDQCVRFVNRGSAS